MSLRAVLSILALSYCVGAFKILIIYPYPIYSHHREIIALTERLVEKGHQVFAVSPVVVPGLKQNDNYTFVNISVLNECFSDGRKRSSPGLQREISRWDLPKLALSAVKMNVEQFLSEPFLQFKKHVLSKMIKFDVAIIETTSLSLACPITRILSGDTPIITMATIPIDIYAEDNLGSKPHYSYVPFIVNDYTDKMRLWQRIDNWYSAHYLLASFRNTRDSIAEVFLRDNYAPDSENLVKSCYNDVSLSLVTSNFLSFYPRLLGPNVVEVGPLHLKPPERLPKELQDWLDGSAKGVIYFSFGSNMMTNSLPEPVIANFLKFFRELPPGYRVLWKWGLDGKVPGQSDNILAQKWLPQESVLAHPNVRVFITQGGLQSFQEAIHYGVPLVGIPWFGDQGCNVAKMVDAEVGVRLLPTELHSYEKLQSTIEAVLYDERYLQNMKRYSSISHDFTAQGMDKAVFWVEHIAKFGGAHLRPSTADTTLFEYFCWDIISVIVILGFMSIYTVYSVSKFLISILYPKSRAKPKSD